MMIVMEGPDVEDEAAVTEIANEAFAYWKAFSTRMPSRSHPDKVMKPRKSKSEPLSDKVRRDAWE